MERLTASPDAEGLHERRAAFYLTLAENAEPELRGRDQEAWLDRLDRERANLSASARWATARGDADTVLREDDRVQARRYYELALETARADIDWRAIALTLLNLGLCVRQDGDLDLAEDPFEETLGISRALGDRVGVSAALDNLGDLALIRNDPPSARARYGEALLAAHKGGDRRRTIFVLHGLSSVAAAANRETLVCLMLEEVEAIENLPDLVKVPGVDVFFIGSGDLSQSMGLTGQQDHPEVQTLMERGVRLITEAGRIAGCSCPDALMPRFLGLCVQYFHSTVGRLLQHGSNAYLKNAREAATSVGR